MEGEGGNQSLGQSQVIANPYDCASTQRLCYTKAALQRRSTKRFVLNPTHPPLLTDAMNQGSLVVRSCRAIASLTSSVNLGRRISAHRLVIVQLSQLAVSSGEMGVQASEDTCSALSCRAAVSRRPFVGGWEGGGRN